MSYPGYLGLVIVLCIVAVCYLKLNCLYLLLIDAFIQNTALPFLYTSLGASQSLIASLLISKEILLLILCIYCIFLWRREVQRPWPKPVYVLIFFTAYCVIRVGFGILLLGDDPWMSYRRLRLVCLPLQFLIIAMTVVRVQPEFATRLLRHMVYLLAILAVVGIVMFILPPIDFWVSHANMADYGIDIKGYDSSEFTESAGIGNTSAGRQEFVLLAPFRAFGTFGDPLAMGFALSTPFLLFAFVWKWNRFTVPGILVLALAIFATFDRSVWIFLFVTGLIVLVRERRYKWLAAFAMVPILAILTVPPLAEFARYEYDGLSWTNPDNDHAQGIVWFYQRAFTDAGNIIGKGPDVSVERIPESGYGFLAEHFGLVAYFSWLWFMFSMYRYLKSRESAGRQLIFVMRAMIVGMFVVMHFSHYPFAFIGWLPIWYIFGLSMAGGRAELSLAATPNASLPKPARELLPGTGSA
jgi:hypothetical protein